MICSKAKLKSAANETSWKPSGGRSRRTRYRDGILGSSITAAAALLACLLPLVLCWALDQSRTEAWEDEAE